MEQTQYLWNDGSIPMLCCTHCEHISTPEYDVIDTTLSQSVIAIRIREIICPMCGKTMTCVDGKLVNIISILNQKGYTTSWCCQGHGGTTIDMRPKNVTHWDPSYIEFCDTLINLGVTLPEHYVTMLYSYGVSDGSVIHADDKTLYSYECPINEGLTFDEYQTKCLTSLQKWAEDLPYIEHSKRMVIKDEA